MILFSSLCLNSKQESVLIMSLWPSLGSIGARDATELQPKVQFEYPRWWTSNHYSKDYLLLLTTIDEPKGPDALSAPDQAPDEMY